MNFCDFSDGTILKLEESWNIFQNIEGSTITTSLQMPSILTQMEHPILFKPFLTLHPCKTAEIINITDRSQNKVLTFISSIGPSIQLTMDLKYAKYYDDSAS